MSSNGVVGVKRPFQNNGAGQRKRPMDADDDLIDEAFDMEPTQEDMDEPLEVLAEEDPALGEAGKNWQRPPPPAMDAASHRLVFQQIEVDYSSGPPNATYYQTDLKEVPIVRMYGVNELGKATCTTASPRRHTPSPVVSPPAPLLPWVLQATACAFLCMDLSRTSMWRPPTQTSAQTTACS